MTSYILANIDSAMDYQLFATERFPDTTVTHFVNKS